MGALVFALIMAYFITRAIDAGREQARTEAGRLREEVTRNVREAREAAGRARRHPAWRTAARAAAGAWRGMQGARRDAGPRARRIAARTGPLRRVIRAAWEGGRLGVREGRARRSARGSWSLWPPRIGVCGECNRPTLETALRPSLNGPWRVCVECLAESLRPRPEANGGGAAPDPAAGAWDAEIVPDPALGPAGAAPPPTATPTILDAEIVPDPEPPDGAAPPGAQPAGTVPAGIPGQFPEADRDDEPSLTTAAAQAAVPPAGHPAITTGEPMTTGTTGAAIALPAGIGGTVSVTGGVAGAGGGGGDSRTHGLWLTAVARQAAFTEAVKQHLNGMAAKLYSAEGGRTQIRDIYAWHREADAFIGQLGDMVAAIDPGEQQFIAAIPGGDLDEMCTPHYYATGGRR